MAKVVNAKTSFLHENLKEEIHMEWPPGMKDASKNDCIIFKKYICGLVQAVRQYNSETVQQEAFEIFKKVSFIGGNINPCLDMANGKVYIVLCLDDNLMVAKPQTIDEAVELLQATG